MNKKKKVLILGSTGLIGHQVYNFLKDNGDFELFNFSYRKKINDETSLLDVRNTKIFVSKIRLIKPDFVINCVGCLIGNSEKNLKKAILINSYLPKKLSELGDKINFKLIHMSTDCVFSGNKTSPYLEIDKPDGKSNYAKTKANGEVISDNHLTIRTSVIGPELRNDGTSLFHWFMNQSGSLEGYCKSIWSGVSSFEVAKAIKFFIQNDITGLYHLTNNTSISKYDLLNCMKRHSNKKIEIIKVDGIVSNKSFIDTRKELDYEIPDFDSQVIDIIQRVKQNRKLYKQYKF